MFKIMFKIMFKMMVMKVPQREASPVFVGRDWVFREIQEQFNSSLPTNRGILISGQGIMQLKQWLDLMNKRLNFKYLNHV